MKCAGAPLKHTFLIDDIARRAGYAGRVNIDQVPLRIVQRWYGKIGAVLALGKIRREQG
jgi:hypothetical protein